MWVLADYHVIPGELEENGVVTESGRHGFYFPEELLTNQFKNKRFFPYTIFQNNPTENFDVFFNKFVFDDEIHNYIMQYTENCGTPECPLFVPDHCKKAACAGLLTSDFESMNYVIEHVKEFELKLKVYFLGHNLKRVLVELKNIYSTKPKYVRNGSNFLVLHFTPSEIISGQRLGKFFPITMPRCEEIQTKNITGCKYELTPLMKLSCNLFSIHTDYGHQALLRFSFFENQTKQLIEHYENYEDQINDLKTQQSQILSNDPNVNFVLLDYRKNISNIYNRIACEWLKDNKEVYQQWIPKGEPTITIKIGGIFPYNASISHSKSIISAVNMAQAAIKRNPDILPNYNLAVVASGEYEKFNSCKILALLDH